MNLSGVVRRLRGLYVGSATHGRVGSSSGGGGGGGGGSSTLSSKHIRIEKRIIVAKVNNLVCIMRPVFWLEILHKQMPAGVLKRGARGRVTVLMAARCWPGRRLKYLVASSF
jgi:hypothetical protein